MRQQRPLFYGIDQCVDHLQMGAIRQVCSPCYLATPQWIKLSQVLCYEDDFNTELWCSCKRKNSNWEGLQCAEPRNESEAGARKEETSLEPYQASESYQSPDEKTSIQKFLYPEPEDLPDDFSMPIWDHLDELRERVIVAALAAGTAVLTCFCFSKDLVVFLEAPVAQQGVRFLQLSPGEFFFTTIKVSCEEGVLSNHWSSQ